MLFFNILSFDDKTVIILVRDENQVNNHKIKQL